MKKVQLISFIIMLLCITFYLLAGVTALTSLTDFGGLFTRLGTVGLTGFTLSGVVLAGTYIAGSAKGDK